MNYIQIQREAAKRDRRAKIISALLLLACVACICYAFGDAFDQNQGIGKYEEVGK